MNALIIDDDPVSVFLAERLLKREGLSDTAASFQSPVKALEFLRQQIPTGLLPQVILLDLNMPLLDGWGFLDALHPLAVQLQGRCAIYLLTSSLAPSDTVRAQDYPMLAGVIRKPLDRRKIQDIQEHVTPAAA